MDLGFGSFFNEYKGFLMLGKGGRGVGLTTLLHSGGEYIEIWEPQQIPEGLSRPVYGLL
jgi:hypothetical protein